MRPCNMSGFLRPLVCSRCNYRKEVPTYAGIRSAALWISKQPAILLENSDEKRDNRHMGLAIVFPVAVRKEVGERPSLRISIFLRSCVPSSILSPLPFYRR